MTQELRERVARVMARKAYSTAGLERVEDPYTPDADYWLGLSDAAIALVLEEAAKVVMDEREKDFPDFRSAAAAIRALGK